MASREELGRAQFEIAMRLVDASEADAALQALRAVIELTPENVEAWNSLGVLYHAKGMMRAALECLQVAFRYDEKNTTVWHNIEQVCHSITSKGVGEDLLVLAPTAKVPRRGPSGAAPDVARLMRWENEIYRDMWNVVHQIIPLLPVGGVLVDIGANSGSCTALVKKYRRCKAYLFEPIPEYAQYCRERFRGDHDVLVEEIALSDRAGELKIGADSKNLGWNTTVGKWIGPEMRQLTVGSAAFDDWAEELKIERVDVMKIDVEGGEFKVLAGMHRTLTRLAEKPYIHLEINGGMNSHPHWNEEVEQFEWLIANGYQRFDYQVTETTEVLICPVGKPLLKAVLIPH